MSRISITDSKGFRYTVDDTKSIGSGGEACIYSLNNGNVVKLYHNISDAITPKKINELTVLDDTLFVKPLMPVHGDKNGYIMKELDLSKYYPIYSLYSSSFVLKNGFPRDYKKVISEKLIKAVKNAHDNNIVIGDLNPFNIMVNNQLDVKFIDVDSYQTVSYKHNDKLLEDIRDYYYNGKVSKESDYFSLSIIVFCLFTGIHPYKGIHTIYRDKLKDREINNISLLNEKEINNIKVPKFYVPIDNSLKDMFYQLYQLNKRFLINMEGKTIADVKFDAIVASNELLIRSLFKGNILNVCCSNKFMAIFNDKDTQLYSLESKGIIVRIGNIDKKYPLILTDKNIFTIYNNHLYLCNVKEQKFTAFKSLMFNNVYLIKQYENILVVITKDDKHYTIYLDEIFANNIRYTVDDVYHKTFTKVNGLIQRINNSSTNIFYNSNGKLMQNMIPEKVVDIIQNRNTGIYTVIENNNVIHKLFYINQYGNMKTKSLTEMYPFTSNDKFVILYCDDKLHFLDKETLNEVVSFEANGLDNCQIMTTQSGIVTFNNSECQILNTK